MNSFLKAFVDSLVNARVDLDLPPSPLAEARDGRWLHLVGQQRFTRLPIRGDPRAPALEINARVARKERSVRESFASR